MTDNFQTFATIDVISAFSTTLSSFPPCLSPGAGTRISVAAVLVAVLVKWAVWLLRGTEAASR